MKVKRLISAALSGIMLLSSGGIIPVSAEETTQTPPELQRLTEDTRLFDITDYYTSPGGTTQLTGTDENGAGWTLAEGTTLDNDTNHFLGMHAGDTVMGNGYGADMDWIAMSFNMVANSSGDFAIYDTQDKGIIGNCYANSSKKDDYFWIGHGERSYGGTIADSQPVNRFSHYLKTEVATASGETKTGRFNQSLKTNPNSITCSIVVENENGTVSELIDSVLTANSENTAVDAEAKTYTGDYYTVKTYQNNDLISTEYYSGHIDGIKKFSHKGTNYYGNLKIYGGVNTEPEKTPTIAIDYTNEKLTGFTLNEKYTIDDTEVIPTETDIDITEYIGKTISIIKKGNGTNTTDSEAQSLIISSRPNAPSVSVAAPETATGQGKITGTTTAMEYKSESGNWTDCTADNTEVSTGKYSVRTKATDNAFASAEASVTVPSYTAVKETTPTIAIDYSNEKLTGFTANAKYTIDNTEVTPATTDIDITEYIGKTISIIKKGDGTNTADSESQSLVISARPNTPSASAENEQTYQGNDGKITGVTTDMEYRKSSENSWTACGGTEITSLTPGEYKVRIKATNSAFASIEQTLTITAKQQSVTPPSPPIEDNEMTAYVFAYFRRPPGQRDDERICLGVSRDGYSFRTLNGGEPVFAPKKTHTPTLQYEALRDLFIMRGEDSKFYIVVTDLLGTANPNHQITIYPSDDLVNIERGIVIDYSKYTGFENTTRAWAPQIIWCPEHQNADNTKGAYMIYLAICKGNPATESTDMYKHFTTDLSDPTKYTVPEKMLAGETEASIDGDIIYDEKHNEYIMYYNGQQIATSKTIDGTYTKQNKTVFGDTRAVEGSNMFKLNKTGKQTEDKWIYCADGGSFGTGFNMAETSDFTTYKELKAADGGFDYDFTPRHGYVVPITESELNKLMDTYGYVDLPDRFSENPLVNVTLPYTERGYKIAGNITLPESVDGMSITWTSSDSDTINTSKTEFTAEQKAQYGANYTEIPAGKVTRPTNADKKVTLTAAVTKDGTEYTKKFVVTVKKAPQKNYAQMDADGDFKGYLYASFIEPPKDANGQQVYFASSDDGRNWTDLNNNKPVLTSTMGTGSTRDHYIVRAPEGDRFYIIATDLNCFAKNGTWTQYAEAGSKSLMIWESDDLVNWSKQRMVQIADDNTGCAWAPEAIYDELTGEYIVYWSGHDINENSANYGKKVVYYSKTRDFYSFTPQKQYVIPADTDGTAEGTSDNFIDTTMIKGSDNKFYRVTKYEGTSPTRVFMDVADYPLGTFTRANTNLTTDNALLGTEGPGWFKYNKDDAETFGAKYCLMLDGYNGPNKGVGFFPTTVTDLNGGDSFTFTRLMSGFKMRTNAKHGGIIQLTQEELDRVNEVYKSYEHNYVDEKPTAAVSYDFENNALTDIANANFTTGASLVSDNEKESKVLYLNGTAGSYMEFDAPKDENNKVLEEYTVSFDVKNQTTGNFFNFYIGDGSSNRTGINYLGVKATDSILISTKDASTEKKVTLAASGIQNNWCHFDIVVSNGIVQVYVDNVLKGCLEGYMMSDINASKIRFGFSAWSPDKASNAYYDNITVYPAALSDTAIRGKVDERPALDANTKNLLFAMNFNAENSDAIKGKATVNGNISYGASDDGSKAAYLDGASFLSLTNADGTPLLKGKNNVAVTMRVKPEQNTSSAWYFYTAPNANAQTGSKRYYAGLLNNYTNMISERFLNNKDMPTVTTPASTGAWQDITLIIGENKQELYVDGKSVGTAEYNYTLSQILGTDNTQVTYIGKANWGDGEFLKGYVDDIAIYDMAPLAEVENASNIKSDIELPTATIEKDGYSLTWKSSNESVVSSTGKVTRPQTGKNEIKLTATIKFGNTTLEKTFDVTVKGYDYYDLKLDVHNKKGVDIQENMYGLFFEDINYAADGGLYAEMIENRSFEELKHSGKNQGSGAAHLSPGEKWSAVSGTMAYKTEKPLNDKNKNYLSFTGKSFQNDAYEGMFIEQGKQYKVSFYARKGSYTGDFTVKAGNGFSEKITDADKVSSKYDNNGWAKYEKTVTATGSANKAKFVIELDTSATVDFDVISVMPGDAACGLFRKDLADKLKAMNPGFVRFPGGCIIEGWDLENRYQWKQTVGPIEERTQNWNRWASSGFGDYNQTFGMGYYEYFILCEYLDCDPLPVQNVGLSCPYNAARETVPIYKTDSEGNETDEYTEEFWEYVQDTLDLIDFANSTDFENNEWASLRKSMGHEEPFNLTMVGIGNEQWEAYGYRWYERYEIFEKEIHKRYPDIKLIGTSGPTVETASYRDSWKWIREKQAKNDKFTYAVDEHYYMSPEWFLENDDFYDDYDRSAKVFAGEYAAHTTRTTDPVKRNNLESALAEAAFLTGVERNADVVYLASYAPLFARIGYTQWAPDMIWYDGASSYGSPSYYVQSMYSNNNGTYTLEADAEKDYKIYHTQSYDAKTGDIIIKIANPHEYEQRIGISVDDSFDIAGQMSVETLSGDSLDDVNSIANPENIAPQKETQDFTNGMDYTLQPLTFAVIRIHTDNGSLMNLTKFSNADGKLSYKLTPGGSFDEKEYDVYSAVYNENGTLVRVLKNNFSGEIDIDDTNNYELKVMVWEKDTMKPADNYEVIRETTNNNSSYKLMSYTTTGSEYYAWYNNSEANTIGNSLHLAVSSDGGASYQPLNSNVGVLFAEADYSETSSDTLYGDAKMLRSPYLFKMNDGSYGVITARADAAGAADVTDGKAMIYTSKDLTEFDFLGYIPLDTKAVYEPACVYENGAYKITWANADGGARKMAVTENFKTIGDVTETTEKYNKYKINIDEATAATNVLNISKSVYNELNTKLNAPENTGIKSFEDMTVSKNSNVTLPSKATATYNDGSEQEFNVAWDTSKFDTSKSGEYTVSGTVQTKDYPTNFLANRADPCALKADGKYYFVATRDSGGQTVLNIRVSDTLDGIATAEDHTLYEKSGSGLIWAPEIHNVDGKLMIFFADSNTNWSDVQCSVMILNGDDAAVKANWSALQRIKLKDGTTNIIDNGISLDMTCFKWNNKWYLAWSQRRVNSGNKNSHESANIYIAEYDPVNPTKLASDTAVISRPKFGWERSRTAVDEGPFTIVNDGKLYMTIAANGTDSSYGIKLMTLKDGGNPLNPEDWKTKGYPLLCTSMNTAEPGPGHSSFTVDENGDPVLVYHWGRNGSGRTTSIKNVHFNTNGEPVLNILRGEQVKNEYKDVTVKVIVE